MNEEKSNQKSGNYKELTKGIIKQNPIFVMLLGMCPTLGVSTMAMNGIGMGVATTFVLLFSNVLINLLRGIIPNSIRIPAYIVTISGFTTLITILVKAFLPSIYDALGIYLPLIAVNCIIMGRAEMFASKNKLVPSILDALGMGAGFTLALFIISSIREILGSGTFFGIDMTLSGFEPMTIFILPAGGFFVVGILIALVNKLMIFADRKPKESFGCGSGCDNCRSCTQKEDN